MSELRSALLEFRNRVNGDERLKTMNRDWNRVIAIEPTDAGERVTIRYIEGMMQVDDEPAPAPDITLVAPGGILADVFAGRMSPTEPYLEGTLAIRGSQEDVLRLDFLSLMIWGE